MNPISLALEAIRNFSLSETVSQVSAALSNMNFIQWFTYYKMDWNEIIALVQGDTGFSATSFANTALSMRQP